MENINRLLILPHLRVQGANAVSGPLTWGFPSPTAFTGFTHALERHLRSQLPEGLYGVGIICHRFEPQVFKPPGKYTRVFQLSRNPVDKDGSTSALIEEGRAHLEITLLIGVKEYLDDDDAKLLLPAISNRVMSMRLAGGSILPPVSNDKNKIRLLEWPGDETGQRKEFRKLRRSLLPGFALTSRADTLQKALSELQKKAPEATALDALLDISRLNIEPAAEADENGQYPWAIRKQKGWLVPIPVGYAGISPLHEPGSVRNSRDNNTPFRFVESLYSVGEWVSPHRIDCLEQLLWHNESDPETGIYRCINHYSDYLSEAAEGAA